MDEAVASVLAEYDERRERESALFRSLPPAELARRSDEFLISVGPEVGRFLNELIKGAGARHILELGTSYGHSTVFLAEAARATGGRVVSCDVHAGKQAYARARLEQAGLADRVELRLGDAHATIPTLDDGIEFVLVDLWKDLYISTFELFRPKLASGAYVAADNMLVPEAARPHALAYRRHVAAQPGFDSVLLPIGQGIELSRLGRGAGF